MFINLFIFINCPIFIGKDEVFHALLYLITDWGRSGIRMGRSSGRIQGVELKGWVHTITLAGMCEAICIMRICGDLSMTGDPMRSISNVIQHKPCQTPIVPIVG